MLFRVSRQGAATRWVVLLGDRLYGEYADKDQALMDAIDAAQDARESGQEAEVWDQTARIY
jgi:hypothetical protein